MWLLNLKNYAVHDGCKLTFCRHGGADLATLSTTGLSLICQFSAGLNKKLPGVVYPEAIQHSKAMSRLQGIGASWVSDAQKLVTGAQ